MRNGRRVTRVLPFFISHNYSRIRPRQEGISHAGNLAPADQNQQRDLSCRLLFGRILRVVRVCASIPDLSLLFRERVLLPDTRQPPGLRPSCNTCR